MQENYQILNAYICLGIEKELKKLEIYDSLFREWSEYYFQFMKNLDSYYADINGNLHVFSNENITLNIIERELEYKKRNVVSNPNITIGYIIKYKDLHWNIMDLCMYTKKISFKEMKDLREYNKNEEFVFEYMHYITIKDVIYNLDLDYQWNLGLLSESENITFDEYKKYRDNNFLKNPYNAVKQKRIDMNKNPNISKKDILENPDYPWDSEKMKYFNKTLTYEDYIELGFNIDKAYINNPELYYFEKYKNIDWISKHITSSPKITVQQIIDNPQYKWEKEEIFANPNITFLFLTENYQKICKSNTVDVFAIYENLMSNPMTYQRVTWMLQKITNYYINTILFEEIMIKSWHPNRFKDWCLCDDEYVFLFKENDYHSALGASLWSQE